MAPRGRHVEKTRAQRKHYVENVVKGQEFSSTILTSLAEEGSATDSPMPRDDDESLVTESVRPRSRRDPDFFERYKREIVKGVIGLVAAAVIGVVGLTVIVLNRDVGKLQQFSEDTTRSVDKLDSDLRRQQSALDKIRDRIDDLRDRIFSGGVHRQSKKN